MRYLSHRWGMLCLFATMIVAACGFAFGDEDTACRDPREAHKFKQRDLSSVMVTAPSVLWSIRFEGQSPGATFAIKGTLCDSELRALGDKSFRIVLVEREEAAGDGPLPADAFISGLAQRIEIRRMVTSSNGKFLVTGLPPGEYVLEVDLEDLRAEYVVFDLRHIPGPPLRSSVERIGLIRPKAGG